MVSFLLILWQLVVVHGDFMVVFLPKHLVVLIAL